VSDHAFRVTGLAWYRLFAPAAMLTLLVTSTILLPAFAASSPYGADPARGKEAVERYGCIACHAIPGIALAGGNVGPPLKDIRRRAYLAGVLPNTAQNLTRWLQNPALINPRSAMPNMGISEAEASDIAAYLYSLD
jgi:cytochrome c